MTVRVEISPRKAREGAEKSFHTRKTRRGQRRGKERVRVRQTRTLCPPALDWNAQSPRKVNHRGRKHLWAVVAANRLSARKEVRRLIEKLPEDLGYLSRSRARDLVKDLGVGIRPAWNRFARSWHVYSYKARHMGAHPEGSNPLHFLGLRAPHVGGDDLMDLLGRSGLRPAPPPAYPGRRRVCRSCGSFFPSDADHPWSRCKASPSGPSRSSRGSKGSRGKRPSRSIRGLFD